MTGSDGSVTPLSILRWLQQDCGWSPALRLESPWASIDAPARMTAIMRIESFIGELPTPLLDSLTTVDDFCSFAAVRLEASGVAIDRPGQRRTTGYAGETSSRS